MGRICFTIVFALYLLTAMGLGQVSAQSSCIGALYCNGACNVESNSCSCSAQVCETGSGGVFDGTKCIVTVSGVGTCIYQGDSYCSGSCQAFAAIVDTFTCPGWKNTCVNYCTLPGSPAEPTPDPDGQMAPLAAAHRKGMIGG